MINLLNLFINDVHLQLNRKQKQAVCLAFSRTLHEHSCTQVALKKLYIKLSFLLKYKENNNIMISFLHFPNSQIKKLAMTRTQNNVLKHKKVNIFQDNNILNDHDTSKQVTVWLNPLFCRPDCFDWNHHVLISGRLLSALYSVTQHLVSLLSCLRWQIKDVLESSN